MNLRRRSIITGRFHTMWIPGLTQGMLDAYKDGALAQDAFPSIPSELREFIMTGITPSEWNEHFYFIDDSDLGYEETK